MSEKEGYKWEEICNNCGECCLQKTVDEDGNIHALNIRCPHLTLNGCGTFNDRSGVKNCVEITKEYVKQNKEHLPKTCPYRILEETGKLPEDHHLITGCQKKCPTSLMIRTTPIGSGLDTDPKWVKILTDIKF